MTVLNRKNTVRHPVRVWLVRGLLAFCLLYASEIILWTDITRPLWLWGASIIGYAVIATVLLDTVVRFKIYELFGTLVLAGFYALLAGFLIHPSITLTNLPNTLISRILGAQFVAGIIGIGLFLQIVKPTLQKQWVIILAVVVGALWGFWVKDYPLLIDKPEALLSMVEVIVVSVIPIAGIAALGFALSRHEKGVPEVDFLMTRIEWVGIGLAIAVLFGLHLVLGNITRNAISFGVVVLSYMLVVFWFQTRTKPGSILPAMVTVERSVLVWVMITGAVMIVAGVVATLLPLPTNQDLSPVGLLSITFGMLGLVWLPTVSIVLGVRAYRQQIRTGQPI